jgi:RNase P/RNase MRP subunit POP5
MTVKLNPSEKIKKRYLLIQGSKAEVEKAILDYIGILGWAKAKPSFLETGKGLVLAVERTSLNDIKASFELCKDKIKVLKVSGTLKSLE